MKPHQYILHFSITINVCLKRNEMNTKKKYLRIIAAIY